MHSRAGAISKVTEIKTFVCKFGGTPNLNKMINKVGNTTNYAQIGGIVALFGAAIAVAAIIFCRRKRTRPATTAASDTARISDESLRLY